MDFIIQEPENKKDLGSEILIRICQARLRAGFQVFIFIAGGETTGTGHGKSYFVLRWIDKLLAKDGIDFMEFFEDIIVFTPLEYGTKMKAMLNDQRLNRIHVLMIDEVSEVLDVGEWQSYVNKTIRSVNVKARGIKNLVVFFLSPDIHDMEKGSRRMLTFYGECTRPLSGNTRVILERPYKIRRGLEDVFYNTRPIKGIVRGKEKRKNYFLYPKFTIKLPRKELADRYDILQRERKGSMVSADLDELIQHLEKKYGDKFDRVDLIINQFISKPEMQPIFFKWRKSRKTGEDTLKLQPEFIKAFKLTDTEIVQFLKVAPGKFKHDKKFEEVESNVEPTTIVAATEEQKV
jgi:hypothetical protein